MLDDTHWNEVITHLIFALSLVSEVFEVSSDLLLIASVLILVQLACSIVNEVFGFITMSSDSTKKLDELSSMLGTHLDVEQQPLVCSLCSEISASCYPSVTDDGPLLRLQILSSTHNLFVVW